MLANIWVPAYYSRPAAASARYGTILAENSSTKVLTDRKDDVEWAAHRDEMSLGGKVRGEEIFDSVHR